MDVSGYDDDVKRVTLECALIVLVGALAYSNTFHVPFTFDDRAQILSSPMVRDLAGSLAELPHGLRAVGRLTFAANYAVHGFDVPGYHLVNLLVHLCAALGVYALARTALRDAGVHDRRTLSSAATAAGLLFVAHPVQTQAVTYIVQRYTSLATALYVLSILLYARSRLARHPAGAAVQYGAALIMALLAMRTKEIAFTLPLALVLYDLVLLDGGVRERLRRLTAPLLLLPVVPVVHYLLFAPGATQPGLSGSLDTVTRGGSTLSRLDYLLTQARVFMSYLRLLVLPISQNVDYDYPVSRSLDGSVLVSVAGVLAVCGAGCWLAILGRRDARPLARVAGFGILFFPLALSVESTLVPIRDVIAEHRLYLPSVGASLAAGAGVAALHRIAGAAGRRAAVAIAVAFATVIAALAVATFERNEVWSDPAALWADAVAKSPGKLRPLLNLKDALRTKGDEAAARAVAVRALAIRPVDHEELTAVGFIYREMGDLEAARAMWEAAVEARPGAAVALMSLGHLAFDRGDAATARRYLEKAVEADPLLAQAHLKLAIVLDSLGETRRSLEEFALFTRYASSADSERVRQVQEMLRARAAASISP